MKKREHVKNIVTPITPQTILDLKEAEECGINEKRGTWTRQLEFFLTCLGFAVGLGNVWRFPYLCYKNGGGVFLIPYMVMLLLVGLPLFYMETILGQFSSRGPISVWSINPLLKGVGWASVCGNTSIVIYYNIIVAWSFYYFFASMNSVLPWASCGNHWNTQLCYDGSGNTTGLDTTLLKTPTEEYFYNNVLRLSEGIDQRGSTVWQLALCLFMAWIIIFFVISKGVASLGKASYFVTLFPYVIMTVLLIRGLTLPGAGKGLAYYLYPDFRYLLKAQVWADAATQIFFSLGCCIGNLIAMASFNNFHNNIRRDAILIPLINCGTSIYAGFVIFSVLGYMAEIKGVNIDEVADKGPGLVFVVYTEALATMPLAPLWAVLFFFMLITLGFSTQFSSVQGSFSAIMDELPAVAWRGRRPILLRTVFCTAAFLIGLLFVCQGGFYLFKLVDEYVASYPLLVVGFCELGAVIWYGRHKFYEDVALMIDRTPGLFWRFCWCVASPLILIVMFLFKILQHPTLSWNGYIYPPWAQRLGWFLAVYPIGIIVIYFFCRYMYIGGWKVWCDYSQPSYLHRPAFPRNRKGRYSMPEMSDEYQRKLRRSESMAFKRTTSRQSSIN